MSNGLKDFMTRLANVYRTATGSTDKIIANTIPDLYEELLENAGSGGSGGSLPSGVYYQPEANLPIDKISFTPFVLNNQLYCVSIKSTTEGYIYKFENGSFVQHVQVPTEFAKLCVSQLTVKVFHNKVFFFEYYGYDFCTWDGTNFTMNVNAVDFSANVPNFYVLNDELYCGFSSKEKVNNVNNYWFKSYKYDEETNTFGEKVYNGIVNTDSTYVFNIGNSVYMFGTDSAKINVYTFDGSNITLIDELTFRTSSIKPRLCNDKIYFIGQYSTVGGTYIRIYDVLTKELSDEMRTPYTGWQVFEDSGKTYITSYSPYNLCYSLHMVE